MSPSVSVRLLLSQSDEQLVGYARAGHERAFEALVQRYRRQLLAYCRRLLLSDQHAEDALQQALLQAWVALRDGGEVSEPRAWLYRIVHNAAVTALRVSRYDYCQLNESLSGADAPQADLDRRIAVREALAGLAALPEMQRAALLRTAVEGRTHQQVAADLGLSEPALRGLVYRARASLRSATSAIVPPPLIGWALDAGTRGAPVLERAGELGAGGSAGLAGLLLKGGAVAVTAGALAGGIVATHTHRASAHQRRPAKPTAARAGGQASATGTAQQVAFTRPDGVKATPPPQQTSGRTAPLLTKGGPQAFLRGSRHTTHREPPAGSPPAPIANWPSPPPTGHTRHGDGAFEPASNLGGHDGSNGLQLEQGGERDEPHSSGEPSRDGGGDGSGGGEQVGGGGTATEQTGQTGEDHGGSSSDGKDSSTSGDSSESPSGGATGASGYKDHNPTTEGSQQKGD